MWQLGSNKRTFLPRLGGPVTAIAASAADPAQYTVTQADNTVRLVRPCIGGCLALYLLLHQTLLILALRTTRRVYLVAALHHSEEICCGQWAYGHEHHRLSKYRNRCR